VGFGGELEQTLNKGWYADLAGNFSRVLGVVFQVGGSYKSVTESTTIGGVTATATADLKLHQFMGGMRANLRTRAVTPFAEFLLGGINSSASVEGSVIGVGGGSIFSVNESESSTNFAIQAGGGVTVNLTDSVGVRAAGSYLRLFGEDDSLHLYRFAGGVVLSF
jgi:opacity protein-like surface antigen